MLGLLASYCSLLDVPPRETRLQRLLRNHCYGLMILPKPGRLRMRILLDEHCVKLQIPDKFHGDDWSDSDCSTVVGSNDSPSDHCPSLVSDTTLCDGPAEGFSSARATEETRGFQRRQGITEYRPFVVQPWTANDVFD